MTVRWLLTVSVVGQQTHFYLLAFQLHVKLRVTLRQSASGCTVSYLSVSNPAIHSCAAQLIISYPVINALQHRRTIYDLSLSTQGLCSRVEHLFLSLISRVLLFTPSLLAPVIFSPSLSDSHASYSHTNRNIHIFSFSFSLSFFCCFQVLNLRIPVHSSSSHLSQFQCNFHSFSYFSLRQPGNSPDFFSQTQTCSHRHTGR